MTPGPSRRTIVVCFVIQQVVAPEIQVHLRGIRGHQVPVPACSRPVHKDVLELVDSVDGEGAQVHPAARLLRQNNADDNGAPGWARCHRLCWLCHCLSIAMSVDLYFNGEILQDDEKLFETDLADGCELMLNP